MLQKIAIKMLGDFSVVADGRCVVDATAKLTKPWQLFCYLAGPQKPRAGAGRDRAACKKGTGAGGFSGKIFRTVPV